MHGAKGAVVNEAAVAAPTTLTCGPNATLQLTAVLSLRCCEPGPSSAGCELHCSTATPRARGRASSTSLPTAPRWASRPQSSCTCITARNATDNGEVPIPVFAKRSMLLRLQGIGVSCTHGGSTPTLCTGETSRRFQCLLRRAQAVEAFSARMAEHGIVTLVSGGEAVHLDRKLDDAENYSEMVNRLAKDYIDWWMLSKARAWRQDSTLSSFAYVLLEI